MVTIKGLVGSGVLVYYSIHMQGRIKHTLCIMTVVVYCIYAMSPIYLSALAAKDEWISEPGHSEQNFTLGIVWLDVLLSAIDEPDLCAPAKPLEISAREDEREFFLIKKKRAVHRETFRIKPLLEKLPDISTSAAQPALPSFAGEVVRRPNFRSEEIYVFSHVGLSPPLRSA
jgi:hypothetical protein